MKHFITRIEIDCLQEGEVWFYEAMDDQTYSMSLYTVTDDAYYFASDDESVVARLLPGEMQQRLYRTDNVLSKVH